MTDFLIEDLFSHISISKIQVQGYSEGLIVALESQHHHSPAKLTIKGISNDTIDLLWSKTVNKKGWREAKYYTEAGALAVAMFLAINYTDYDEIEQSQIGTGFEYFLSYSENHAKHDPINFFQAKLEVSGILNGTLSQIETRIRSKSAQCQSSCSTWNIPGYVSVTEFSTPVSHFIKL
jgi:hypothetical protein